MVWVCKVLLVTSGLLSGQAVRADVSPPVSIKLPPETKPAADGQEYEGALLIHVGRAGVLSDFTLRGDGWTILSADFPASAESTSPGVLRVPFRAVPADANQPLRVRFRHDGRLVKRSFRVGPAAFERAARPRTARPLFPAGEPENQPGAALGGHDRSPPSGGSRGGEIPLRFRGRFVYQRPDGQIVGADHIRVWVFDDDGLASDPLPDEIIWEGTTDVNGYFDSGVILWDDCDAVGCDEPDIYVHFECDTPIAQVQESGVLEEDYFWRTMDNIIENFTGTEVNFGTLAPGNPDEHAAVHIWNSIIRAHRFVYDRSGIHLPIVDVQWPEDESGAWYNPFFEEIHIGPDRTWNEGTHTHEFGHHFLENRAVNPAPDYCNGFCDGADPGCDYDDNCPNEGHCAWCRETDHDAFNEGWPNWLADTVLRDYSVRYTFEDGTPYQPFQGREFENLDTCCVDDTVHDPVRTEGFVAALLRDIDDATQDDHNGDGIMDLLCLGPEEIFRVVDEAEPVTVLDFISAFRATYPQYTAELWSTAFNVGGAAYVAGFPVDTQPPGVATGGSSPSHPIGVGGGLPCITVDFNPAADDATGASVYSVVRSSSPAGQDPGTDPWPVVGTDDCRLRVTVPALALGTHYVSIRARDNAGRWSPQWATFGPFVVTDCNGSGILDVCDISCASEGIPGCLVAGLCAGQPGCGLSSDCNGNFQPDECDIAQGLSEDCNGDGIPDECQTATLKHWTGDDATNPTWWHLGTNWAEGQAPASGNDVCIAAGEPTPLLRQTHPTLGTLACRGSLDLLPGAGLGGVTLTLQQPSFIDGTLRMTQQNPILQVNESLDVGSVIWSTGTLRGSGRTTIHNAHTLSSSVVLTDHTLDLNCNSAASGAFSGNNFTIRNFAGRTYSHNGTGVTVADGNTPSWFINEGTFVKTAGTGSLRFGLRVNNSGLIRAETGTLQLTHMTCTGHVLGLPGTTLTFTGVADFEPGSSLVGDLIWPRTSGATVNVRGTYNAANTTVGTTGELPTLNFLPGASVVSYGDNFIIDRGTANFRTVHGAPLQLNNLSVNGVADFDSGDPVVIQTLTLGPSAGTLRGDSQQFTINGLFRWRQVGGIFDPGDVHAIGGINIEASSSQRDCARVLYNHATATFQGAIGTASTGRFHNLPTGTALLQGDFTGVTGGSVTNEGTIIKNAGTGRSTLALLTNSGLVHAQTGEMYFYFGGANNGEIRGDPGTLLTFNCTNANPHPMSPTSILSADDITFTGQGTSNMRGSVSILDTLTNDGPTVVFASEANVASYGQHLNLLSGTVQYQAPTAAPELALSTATIRGNVHFNVPQPVSVDTLALVTGTIQGSSPLAVNTLFTFNSGTILAGGLMTANGPVSINSTGGTRNIQRNFNNAATMTFVNGGVTASNCTVTNLPGGTIVIPTTGATFGLSSSATLQNNGLIVKSAGDGLSTIGNHFRNAGTVDVQIGTLQFAGTNAITNIQTAGATILNGGNVAVTSPGSYQLQGGVLKGNGTFTGILGNVGGAVEPGLSAGALAVAGTYTQSAGGTLRIEVGGTGAGQFDTLTVSGAATLAGELNVQAINGYTPTTGDTFVILTAGTRNGTFATLTGTPGFAVSYTPTQVILTATTPQLPGDLDGDCDVDLSDLTGLLSNFGTASGATREMGDFDGDGDVDLSDLTTLLANYGQTC